MFTGIVTHVGRVTQAERRADGVLRLGVEPATPMHALVVGASIAVDGVCLTLVHAGTSALVFDVVPETLRCTTLGSLPLGARVNLERALRVGDELGGHWVQGHVDGVAEVESVQRRGADVRLALALPPELAGSAIPKGSVTLDGVSLTVGEVWSLDDGREALSVYLIPHTLAVTTLAERTPGSHVNVEADVLGRWVRHISPR